MLYNVLYQVNCDDTVDKKHQCAALFVDVSKAFNTVDHNILLHKLLCVGFDVSLYY